MAFGIYLRTSLLVMWSSLIWVYTVCICHFVRNVGVREILGLLV